MASRIEASVLKGSTDGKIVQSKTQLELESGKILVQITHSGVCGTDIHYKNVDMVLGHEGVGIVKEVGNGVTRFKPGDRVGWGYQHDSCAHCKQCLTGAETFCPERKMYASSDRHQGSMGSHAVWKQDFLFSIPDALSLEDAAPLMCGGATVFNALQYYGYKSTDRVGVIGIGGLGHLAIQFASKMGCTVAVFSGTDSKRDEAFAFGAKEFYAAKNLRDLKHVAPIDHLLVCTSAQPEWAFYLPVLAPGSTIYPLSVSSENLVIPYMPLLAQGIRIQGSIVATRQVHREMLEFAAAHGIKPKVQKYPMTVEGAEEAFKVLDEGKMRYRAILVAQ